MKWDEGRSPHHNRSRDGNMRKQGSGFDRSREQEGVEERNMHNILNEHFKSLVNRNLYSSIVRSILEYYEVASEKSDEMELTKFYGKIVKHIQQLKSREKTDLNFVNDYLKEVENGLKEACPRVYSLEIETKSRFIVSMKYPYMPLNLGLAIDPYMNVPFIPASSLRGALRMQLSLNNNDISHNDISLLFGKSEGKEGKRPGILSIFDAYPVKAQNGLFEADVITPHYRESDYKIGKREVDYGIGEHESEPNPILFLTVPSGVTFRAFSAVCDELDEQEKQALTKFVGALKNFSEFPLGLGAKTMTGYG
ncbi:MAG: type III-B CRISPR module RAMP protein Cmr6, partial [Fervidicoccaceae archaeon]